MAQITRDEVLAEVSNVEKDLMVFKRARDEIHRRIRELGNEPERQAMFTDWPVVKVIDNGLIMAVVRCEGLLQDYREVLEKMDVPDNVLKLEKNDDITGS